MATLPRTRRIYLAQCPCCLQPLAGLYRTIYHRTCDAEAKATHEASVSLRSLPRVLKAWALTCNPEPNIQPIRPLPVKLEKKLFHLTYMDAEDKLHHRSNEQASLYTLENITEAVAYDRKQCVQLCLRDEENRRLLWWGHGNIIQDFA